MLKHFIALAPIALFACGQTETSGLSGNSGSDMGARDVSVPNADAGESPTDAGVDCSSLQEAQCGPTAGCEAVYCSCGGPGYLGCFGPGDPIPDCAPCGACFGLSENECMFANADCEAHYCTGCDNVPRFQTCAPRGEPVPGCVPMQCPCEGLDEAACAADAQCHRVFSEPEEPCACPTVGCCQRFDRCASGPANCSDDNLACRMVAPNCGGPYVIGYEGTCYEGCVLQTDCQ